jgi:hypothetical protein
MVPAVVGAEYVLIRANDRPVLATTNRAHGAGLRGPTVPRTAQPEGLGSRPVEPADQGVSVAGHVCGQKLEK